MIFSCLSLLPVTFGDFGVDLKVIWGEDIVDPPCETPLLLLYPPLVVKHVLGSKRHRVSG